MGIKINYNMKGRGGGKKRKEQNLLVMTKKRTFAKIPIRKTNMHWRFSLSCS